MYHTLLYRNLIQPLKQKSLGGQTIPANDKDRNFLTAMMQIRRYMYGGLSNKQMHDYLSGRTTKIYFKGVMSFYPLVDDEKQLLELDGWLLSTIYRALQLRCKLLKTRGFTRSNIFPFNETREQLLLRCSKQKIRGQRLLEIPSFLLMHKVIQKGLVDFGIEAIMNPEYKDYNY